MIALLRVELRRATARRTTRAIAALALLGILIAAVVLFIRSGRLVTHIFFDPAAGEQVRTFRELYHLTSLTEAFRGLSFLCIVLAGVLGATFVGAEWHTGSMTTTLTWEPRRVLLWFGKVFAVAIVVLVLMLLLQLILGLLLAVVAVLRGSTEGTDRAWLGRTVALGLRVAFLSAIAGIMSSAVAMVGRNTAAALGIGALYLGVVENLIRAYRPAWQPWLVGDNLTVFIGTPQGFVPLAGRSMVGAGIVLVLYALGVAAVAGGVFRARDVT